MTDLLPAIEKEWDATVVKSLEGYIEIANVSPIFDSTWQENGLLDQACEHLMTWVKTQNVPGLKLEKVVLPGRTPLIFMEVPATKVGCSDTVLLYGHYDKQPPFEGWEDGLDPYKPVHRDGKLYGRGGADDGYSIFTAVTAIRALQESGQPHARCVIIVEGCEESGSFDLPFYVDHLKARIGTPSLIVCLDSGAGDYERMWITTSLRGICVGELHVQILTEGVHSGNASGVVPDSFRIARHLLSRIEDPVTGEVLVPELKGTIPESRRKQTEAAAEVLGEGSWQKVFPFVEGATTVQADTPVDLALNRTWRAELSITGAAGLPSLEKAGNVLRPSTSLKLSMRCPPNVDPKAAGQAMKVALETNPPYGAKVAFDVQKAGAGWQAPELSPWLEAASAEASQKYFGKPAAYTGEGGSIPFMGMLGEKFPEAQFLIVGVLGPSSNAHGPNEFLHIPMAKKLTCCVADVLATHAKRQ